MVTSGYQVRDEVDLGSWEVGEEFVREYLAAVGDPSPAYFGYGLAPPLALAARTLGSLLEHLALPPGAIHSLQEITTFAPVPFGQEVTAKARLGPVKRRGGMDFITAGFTRKIVEIFERARYKKLARRHRTGQIFDLRTKLEKKRICQTADIVKTVFGFYSFCPRFTRLPERRRNSADDCE